MSKDLHPHLSSPARFALTSLLLTGFGTLALADDCDIRGVESAIKCSDLIVLGRVVRTEPEGIEVGPSHLVHTVHALKIEAYYLGSGPEEIRLLTPGGFSTDSSGRRTYLSIVAAGMIGVQVGEEFVAFLQANSPGYRFLGTCSAKLRVDRDETTGERTVTVRFEKKQYMRGAALRRYLELEQQSKGSNTEWAAEAQRLMYRPMAEVVSLSDLRERLAQVIAGEGGPKPASKICY